MDNIDPTYLQETSSLYTELHQDLELGSANIFDMNPL